MSEIGASRPLPYVPAKVSFLNTSGLSAGTPELVFMPRSGPARLAPESGRIGWKAGVRRERSARS
jgi:hypothetical protein